MTPPVWDGDDWVIRGSKAFITIGYSADLIVVAARPSPEKKARGITLFGMEALRPGHPHLGRVERDHARTHRS